MNDSRELFIGGEFVSAISTETIPLINPATEERVGSVVNSNGADVARAVDAAEEALPGWRNTTPEQRGACLSALAEVLDRRRDEMAALVSRHNGTVISRSKQSNAARPIDIYRYHGELSSSFPWETAVDTGRGSSAIVRREPVGVVGAIVPWNAPQTLAAQKLAPALLAGCTVVWKPSPETSLDAFLLSEMLNEVGVPPGVVNIVTGGRGTGEHVVAHPGVDKVSFTGSTAAGRAVAAACGQMLKPVTAELGGKSAAVLLEDAPLDVFARSLIGTCLPNTGQVCYSCTRILAPRKRLGEVLDAVVETLSGATVGDPMDPRSDFGPLVSAAQRTRVEGYIQSGLQEGARLLLGGDRPAQLPVGYYVEPTVFVDVTPEMRIFREEVFGPLLVVVPYDDDDDAVRLSNDSSYGLGGSVFSRDLDRAKDIASRMETGSVLINGEQRSERIPLYGYKDSGVGGDASLAAYLNIKSISGPHG
jgi:aldehyde dehydrogenase (NAD+)